MNFDKERMEITMAKLYWTSEMKKIFDEKIDKELWGLLRAEGLSNGELARRLCEIQICKDFAYEIIADMDAADEKEEAERAARKAAEQKEQEAQDGAGSGCPVDSGSGE